MTAQELLEPRYEIIAAYPCQPKEIGELLDTHQHTGMYLYMIMYEGAESHRKQYTHGQVLQKFPHLFRKLNWWERRTEDQMPKKIKFLQDGSIINVIGWDMKMLFAYDSEDNRKNRSGYGLTSFNPEYGYIPVD